MKSIQIFIAILAALLFSSCSSILTKSVSVKNLIQKYIKKYPILDSMENCGKDYIDGILSQKISIDNEIKILVTKVGLEKSNINNLSYDSLIGRSFGIINIPELKNVIKNYNDYDSVLINYDYVVNKRDKIKIYDTVITLKNKTEKMKIYLDFACTEKNNYLVYIGLDERKYIDIHSGF